MLYALGHENVRRFEGHAALLTLELLDEEARKAGRGAIDSEDMEVVTEKCVFTTHTPVPAGHDQFPAELARRVIGQREDFFTLGGVSSCWGRSEHDLPRPQPEPLCKRCRQETRGGFQADVRWLQSPTGSMRPPGCRNRSRFSLTAISPAGSRTTSASAMPSVCQGSVCVGCPSGGQAAADRAG